MSPAAGMRQFVDHGIGATPAILLWQFAPVDLPYRVDAGGLSRPVDIAKNGDSFRAMFLAFFLNVVAAYNLDSGALRLNAAPQAFICDLHCRGLAFLNRGCVTTRRAHGCR